MEKGKQVATNDSSEGGCDADEDRKLVAQAEAAMAKLRRLFADDDWKQYSRSSEYEVRCVTGRTGSHDKASSVQVHFKEGVSGAENRHRIVKSAAVVGGYSPASVFAVIGLRRLWSPR